METTPVRKRTTASRARIAAHIDRCVERLTTCPEA
jgi:hypothetical protein